MGNPDMTFLVLLQLLECPAPEVYLFDLHPNPFITVRWLGPHYDWTMDFNLN